MDLSTVTWTDVAASATELALLPVGSTEQHGPHAPLGTDTMAAQAVAKAGLDRYDGDALRTPPIHVGVSEEHRQFPGAGQVPVTAMRSLLSG
jgi:creatinine amidohydrolase